MEASGCYNKLRYFLYTKTPVGPWYTKKQWDKAKVQYPNGHRSITSFDYVGIKVTALPVGFDNYCYVITKSTQDTLPKRCVLIDVGDADTAINYMEENQIQPVAVLSTHKHWDHTYGNSELLGRFSDLKIYGDSTCSGVNSPIKEGDEIQAAGMILSVYSTPGHIREHLIYTLNHPQSGIRLIFAGDFVFNAGSGRLYECDAVIQLDSLTKFTQRFSSDDLIFPGHEYALENYRFSEWLCQRYLADNVSKNTSLTNEADEIQKLVVQYAQKVKECAEARVSNAPVVPFPLSEQLQLNLYFRTNEIFVHKLADEEVSEGDQKMQANIITKLFMLKNQFLSEEENK
ncbi:metallo-beta-lactamase superfamily domain-containing protein [Ditylenchus destructor]|uniref:Metallo-beta-lactamase superfamily domain-containing protein n=1 Tax=Ditylenchus destructor TaxID=166010 RepID=A0AAD4MXW0_9BILA|nr:metallo-beta-lactamase superfamily domain-containing protein [Ditylenchus destructor]